MTLFRVKNGRSRDEAERASGGSEIIAPLATKDGGIHCPKN